MPCNNETVKMIAEAIGNTDSKIEYYYDPEEQKVISHLAGKPFPVSPETGVVKIEPMLKDMLELMEDFALEQDSEDIQERLINILKVKDERTAINNFKRTLYDYKKSIKRWQRVEEKWLKDKAVEFLSDYSE